MAAVLQPSGCEASIVGMTSADHYRLAVRQGDRELGRFSISCSPKARDEVPNKARQAARRILKEAGL